MKNKKGFTIVEIIVSLTLLVLIGVTAILFTTNNKKDEKFEEYQNALQLGVATYLDKYEDNFSDLKTEDTFRFIPLDTLIAEGIIDSDETNPYTKKKNGDNDKTCADLVDKDCSMVKAKYSEDETLLDVEYPVDKKDITITEKGYYLCHEADKTLTLHDSNTVFQKFKESGSTNVNENFIKDYISNNMLEEEKNKNIIKICDVNSGAQIRNINYLYSNYSITLKSSSSKDIGTLTIKYTIDENTLTELEELKGIDFPDDFKNIDVKYTINDLSCPILIKKIGSSYDNIQDDDVFINGSVDNLYYFDNYDGISNINFNDFTLNKFNKGAKLQTKTNNAIDKRGNKCDVSLKVQCGITGEDFNDSGNCICDTGKCYKDSECRNIALNETTILEDNKNICVCKENSSYNSTGACICNSGYEQVGEECLPECKAGESRVGKECVCTDGNYCSYNGTCRTKGNLETKKEDNTCACVSNAEYKDGVCSCKTDYESFKGSCLKKCPANSTRNNDGLCVCNLGFDSVNGKCLASCKEGETRVGEECVCTDGNYCSYNGTCRKKVNLETKKADNTCACVSNATYKDGVCTCNSGFDSVNGKCLASCKTGETRVGEECVCTDGNYCSYNGTCRKKGDLEIKKTDNTCACVSNATYKDGVCTCNSGFDSVNGKCLASCKTGETRVGEECVCTDGNYCSYNGTCRKKGNLEIKKTDNTCACVSNAEYKDGVCSCKTDYESFKGSCLKKCTANSKRNSDGLCVCNPGFDSVNGKCLESCKTGETRVGEECKCTDSKYCVYNNVCRLIGNLEKKNSSTYACECTGLYKRNGNGLCECSDSNTCIDSSNACRAIGTLEKKENNKCVCTENATYTNGACTCNEGYVKVGNECLGECPANSTRSGKECVCNSGFDSVNGKCLPKCKTGETRVGEECKCTNSKYCKYNNSCRLIATAEEKNSVSYACECEEGYERVGDECLEKCKAGETRVGKECKCTDSKYCKYNNVCRLIATAEEKNSSTYACECTGLYKRNSNGLCECSASNTCIDNSTKACRLIGDYEKKNSSTYACECADGYEKVGNECLKKCPAHSTRYGKNVCICNSGYDQVEDECLPECKEGETRVGKVCKCTDSKYCTYNNVCRLIATAEEKNSVSYACECTGLYKRNSNGLCECSASNTCIDSNTKACRLIGNLEKKSYNYTCACDTNAHYSNGKCVCNTNYVESNGKCVCKDGYEQVGNECLKKCNTGETRVGKECKCTNDKYCTYNNVCRLIATAEYKDSVSYACECTGLYKRNSKGLCECSESNTCIDDSTKACRYFTSSLEGKDEKTNKCQCPANAKYNNYGACECVDNYEQVGSECLKKCPANSKRNGKECVCNTGYEKVGDECLLKCNSGETRVGKECKCTDSKYCTYNNVCRLIATAEYKDSVSYTCQCTGLYKRNSKGLCECSESNTCIDNSTKACRYLKTLEKKEQNTNKCVCADNAHYENGSCVCNTGYTQNNGICEKSTSSDCGAGKCTYNSKCLTMKDFVGKSNGACSCNYSDMVLKSDGTNVECVCKDGYKFDYYQEKCVKDTSDCGTGKCTYNGKCLTMKNFVGKTNGACSCNYSDMVLKSDGTNVECACKDGYTFDYYQEKCVQKCGSGEVVDSNGDCIKAYCSGDYGTVESDFKETMAEDSIDMPTSYNVLAYIRKKANQCNNETSHPEGSTENNPDNAYFKCNDISEYPNCTGNSLRECAWELYRRNFSTQYDVSYSRYDNLFNYLYTINRYLTYQTYSYSTLVDQEYPYINGDINLKHTFPSSTDWNWKEGNYNTTVTYLKEAKKQVDNYIRDYTFALSQRSIFQNDYAKTKEKCYEEALGCFPGTGLQGSDEGIFTTFTCEDTSGKFENTSEQLHEEQIDLMTVLAAFDSYFTTEGMGCNKIVPNDVKGNLATMLEKYGYNLDLNASSAGSHTQCISETKKCTLQYIPCLWGYSS